MTIYRNVKHTERHYECMNIVACQVPDGAEPPVGDCWKECDESVLDGLTYLHRVFDIRYYGHP